MRTWAISESQPGAARGRRRTLGRTPQSDQDLLLLLELVSHHFGVGAVGDADPERHGLRLAAGSHHPHASLEAATAAGGAGAPSGARATLSGPIGLHAGRPEAKSRVGDAKNVRLLVGDHLR